MLRPFLLTFAVGAATVVGCSSSNPAVDAGPDAQPLDATSDADMGNPDASPDDGALPPKDSAADRADTPDGSVCAVGDLSQLPFQSLSQVTPAKLCLDRGPWYQDVQGPYVLVWEIAAPDGWNIYYFDASSGALVGWLFVANVVLHCTLTSGFDASTLYLNRPPGCAGASCKEILCTDGSVGDAATEAGSGGDAGDGGPMSDAASE